MSAPGAGRRVLLVDDDPVILRGYGQRLRSEGYDVTTAADGYEALTVAGQHAWDLILLDLRIPYRNGVEVLRALRGRKETAAVPVYILSQPGDADFVDRAMREGANGVFEKARIAPRDLVAEVNALAEGRGRAPAAARAPAPAASAQVPAAVDEIARRFRKDTSMQTRPLPRTSIASLAAPAPAPVPAPPPLPQAPQVPQHARVVQRPIYEDDSASGTQRAISQTGLAPSPDATVAAGAGFDVILNRMVGQCGQLAMALGLPLNYTCPICTGPLVLRLEPDPQMEFGVRGHFYCPRCTQG